MALAQAQVPATSLSDKNQAAVEETVKEAKSLLAKNVANIIQPSDKVIVGGAMVNADEEVIRLYKTHNWAGQFFIKPSEQIMMTKPGFFVHQGQHFPIPPFIPPNSPQSMFFGSSGAVLYGNYVLENGQLNNVRPACGWLLAWSVLDNDHHVYVNCGLLEKMKKLKWEEVKAKLDKSGTTSHHVDPLTGAEAAAAISPDGNLAALGSLFCRNNIIN